ncbi:MAG: DNA repair protein RecN [Saprospiraceae bacterium]|nr:DNA repair protein RecN [Saprospiraceae bacterium]MBK7787911.1 DNA repair protein RecN [Saprospiraceae bacterium]MBK8849917.1 DNA repair protein RecN [Saprospiraceae bacterium]MBK9686948.1 DNA repair protein RecN [Saprospiraceae bacterium]MBL0081713.1 DNA repair protein RecN [Saprospiraceae bacterium]
MIKSLEIKNYALIRDLSIDLHKGLNIITGETGAGKSILLGALGLIMGKRADLKVLFDPDSKCVVEARFDLHGIDLSDFFKANDLEADLELIVRREIAPSGKSRAFLNDTPVTLDLLQEVADKLVDLHQQFDTLALHKQPFQQQALDAVADLQAETAEFRTLYKQYVALEKQLQTEIKLSQQAGKEADFISFQLKELNEAKLKSDELTELESRLEILQNAEGIKTVMSKIARVLDEDEGSMSDTLTTLMRELQNFTGIDASFQALYDRLHSSFEEVRDMAAEAAVIAENTEADDNQLNQTQERLNLLYKLHKKHGVDNNVDLIALRDQFASKLSGFEKSDEVIRQLEAELEALKNKMETKAMALRQKREKAGPGFEKKINDLLAQLAMPNARLRISIKALNQFTATGKDEIQFLFATNKGSDFLPLKDVASGGEMARLTLCLKSVIADKMELPTMIFDEIDTGVSGEVASRMGQIMSGMAKAHQLICITHSPQIAAKANQHYFVYKSDASDRTFTSMKLMGDEERLMEIAKMLSGDKPGKAAIENARELITAQS